MDGVGHMGWPDGLTMAIDPVPDTGEIIVDAALEAVTSIKFDVDIYTWESEIDRRGIDVEGEADFSPFLLTGDVPDVVDVALVPVLEGTFEAGTVVGVSVEPSSGSPAPTTTPIVAIATA